MGENENKSRIRELSDELLLRNAAKEAIEMQTEEFAQFENNTSPVTRPESEARIQAMIEGHSKPAVRDTPRKRISSKRISTLAVAVAILTALLISGASAITHIIRLIVNDKEDHSVIRPNLDENDLRKSGFRFVPNPDAIPDGYSIYNEEHNDAQKILYYRDDAGSLLTFIQATSENALFTDNEDVTRSEIVLSSGATALVTEKDGEFTMIVFPHEDCYLFLSGPLDKESMLHIANNIQSTERRK